MNGSVGGGFRIARVLGIQIRIAYSWILIVILLTWTLASSFAYVHPEWGAWLSIGTALGASLLFFVSVLLHELAHCVVAKRFGVPVSSITLFLLGGISNIEREPPSAKAEFWTAVVGPLTSIVLGVVLLAIASAALQVPPYAVADPYAVLALLDPGEALLLWLGTINVVVGFFNLVPAFPLDGGRLLRSALWASTRSLHVATQWASAIGQTIGWFLVIVGVASAFGVNVPFFGRGLVAGLWLVLIGWFVASSAAATWRRQLVHEVLEGLTVSRLMRPATDAVSTATPASHVVDEWLLHHDERAFPVVGDGQRLLGIVTIGDVRKAPRDAWDSTPVAEMMTPADRLVKATAREDLAQALEKLARADVSQLPVVDGERLVGMLLRSDVARWIELHLQEQARPRTYAH